MYILTVSRLHQIHMQSNYLLVNVILTIIVKTYQENSAWFPVSQSQQTFLVQWLDSSVLSTTALASYIDEKNSEHKTIPLTIMSNNTVQYVITINQHIQNHGYDWNEIWKLCDKGHKVTVPAKDRREMHEKFASPGKRRQATSLLRRLAQRVPSVYCKLFLCVWHLVY